MKKILYLFLSFSYLFILLLQIDQSMLEDLGRHLKMGEAILQCLCVPQTNLFSYTNTDFPVINHEWLTQVVLFAAYKGFGLQSLLIIKMVILAASFAIIYYLAKQKSSWYWLTVVSLLSLIIFSSRFRVRPEMFSYLFISLFLLILFFYERHCEESKTTKQSNINASSFKRLLHPKGFAMTRYILFLLPLIQLLWVNIHIYFVLGFMIYGNFLFQDFLTTKKLDRFQLTIGLLIVLATLLNPQFINGALLPFTFMQNYGLSVQENMSVFDFGKYAPSFIYTLTLQVLTFEILAFIFLLTLPLFLKKTSLAQNLNALVTGILGLRFVRSISLFGLFVLQPLAEKCTLLEESLRKRTDHYLVNTLKVIVLAATLFVSYVYANGLYQNKVLQFGYQPYAEDATRFINANELKGPIFNNYQIGNYLIHGLYPREKIFIDARPEMYPKEFLREYEQMLVDQEFFNRQVKKYDINLIVFGVQMEDPLTIRPFMLRQIESKEWIPLFADGNVTILIKNDKKNEKLIEKLRLKI